MPPFRPTSLVLIAALALPALSLAQAPSERQDEQTAPARPAPTPEPPPDERPVAPGDIRIRADSQGGGGGNWWFRGFADLNTGDTRIQCDALDLVRLPEEEGGGRRVVAEGNVVFMSGAERLSGDRLTLDLATGRGTFENAFGFVSPGVFIEGKTIERLGTRTYRVERGRFTACAQPTPRWAFSASSARIVLDDKVTARNVVFRIKGVPAFYIPYLVYPIGEDERSTGFLFPSFGYSSERGVNLAPGFFWAMGRSADQTLYLDYFSKYGLGFGHELRYVRRQASQGRFRTYLFRRDAAADGSDAGGREYDVTWNAQQALPWNVKAKLNARLFSNTTFQRQNQGNLNLASSRRQKAGLSMDKRLGSTSLRLLADYNETFFGNDRKRVNHRLPSLTVSRTRTRIGRTGIVASYDARAEYLSQGNQNQVDQYARFDVAPELARPVAASFVQVNPRVGLRYTRYSTSLGDDGFGGPALDRPLLESSVELRGPMFSRVFLTPDFSYSDKFKHMVGPELVWTYRTAVDDFAAIPKFDGVDQLLGTHQVRYALVNSLLAKRPDPAGRSQPWQLLSWRLQQTYYVQISENQGEFDPNYSSSAFGPGGVPSHYSPLLSQFVLRPSPGFDARFNLEYDVNYDQFRTYSLATRASGRRGSFRANWTRRLRLAEEGQTPEKSTDFVRGSLDYDVLPGRLNLAGAADYDFVNERLLQWRASLRFDVQCCGVMLELVEYDFNERKERQFSFSIQLANIGSMGSFFGEPGRSGSGWP